MHTYGATEPRQIVDAAIAARLHAIAVTDHNTAGWCDRMAEAARDTTLVVLPGLELSTARRASPRHPGGGHPCTASRGRARRTRRCPLRPR
ncbi:PHP domain-containing protein [Micromonospora sp. ANENR4]|uniref:PHP domain-containing protein n=1 Tax=Micromonospora sp. ANENR4 TaxID=2783662 RepID=UPI00351C2FFB